MYSCGPNWQCIMNMQIVVSEVLASPGAMNQSKLAPPGPTGARAGLKSSGSLERNSIVNQGQIHRPERLSYSLSSNLLIQSHRSLNIPKAVSVILILAQHKNRSKDFNFQFVDNPEFS